MFKKFKTKLQERVPNGSAGFQDVQSQFQSSSSQYTPPSNQETKSGEKYEPPPGPPPGHGGSSSHYVPPPGPPPGHSGSNSEYAPPPGPPPSHYPQQPPPSWEPPPYHDWTVIPDNSVLPPPPSIGYDSSPTANASEQDGERAYKWTLKNPLWQPQNLTPAQHLAIQNSQLALLKAPTYIGDLLPQKQPGHWKCRTHAKCKDACLLTSLPAYSVMWDSPLRTQKPKTIYFELKVTGIGRGGHSLEEADAGIAIGYVAPPYPTFRLPGWQRGSLGVHGDDGRRYVNDTYGGTDFTTAFQPDDVVGIGITFAPPKNPPSYDESQQGMVLDIDVFFTRNGVKAGGWDGNEELDQRSEGGTIGLRGECDLFPAIGVFGGVDFEVYFSPENWLYNPY
ncbi:hypothetical protein BU24DRAFT_420644 [Aaosphaeria arxii CBS 175.79]|uniref:SPRY domain-containing protein n=1 Tax=Aaosphaeria arxii CBS 175.79 TaxID=1450172 RepID=A0A6A5XXD4_9PLEO|nr:uncharacterized protein BU24DRAFT_420644 [Aaosphaeria arxii CBS 175.79]KAF2017606.1 hypothetical protein BU24DRAFT_420644 [Aaosphaeria arxii CBS 175.79]